MSDHFELRVTRLIQASPEADGAVLATAAALRQVRKMGEGDSTDLLIVGLSATDYVGHSTGTEGSEMCIQMAGLDRELGDFFARLDATGIDYVVALTADHGGHDLPERNRQNAWPDAQRIDKHPAYVELEKVAFSEFGLAAASHRGGVLGWDKPMPAAAKYALTYLFVQAEFGLCCPLSMTDSLTRTLRKFGDPAVVERFLPNLTTQVFEDLYQGAMFMTEQGAGSDVAATTTRAARDAQAEGGWRLSGDKWFCSNPDAALAMVLASRSTS